MLSHDELEKIVRFINGEDRSVVDTDILERWFRITQDIGKALVRDSRMMSRKAAQLSDRLGRIEERKTAQLNALVATGSFDCMDFDNVDIENAVIHFHKKHHPGGYLTKTKVMHLTYLAYATVLKRYNKRLTLEQPVAAGGKDGKAMGPMFWRKADEINVGRNPSDEVVRRIAQTEPGVRNIIENVVRKYGSYSGDALQKWLVGTAPLLSASKENNGGKWNKPIDDRQTYLWIKSLAD